MSHSSIADILTAVAASAACGASCAGCAGGSAVAAACNAVACGTGAVTTVNTADDPYDAKKKKFMAFIKKNIGKQPISLETISTEFTDDVMKAMNVMKLYIKVFEGEVDKEVEDVYTIHTYNCFMDHYLKIIEYSNTPEDLKHSKADEAVQKIMTMILEGKDQFQSSYIKKKADMKMKI